MIAVILAGGKGTRLGKVSEDIPKPMMNIGHKPVLEHQLELLEKNGITDIIILVNHLKDRIIEKFGKGKGYGVKIRYFEEEKPLGTVGGIKETEGWLKSDFIVFYGDVMINMDLKRLVRFHKKKNSKCTLVLHPNDHPYDSDLVEIDNNQKVRAFIPKPHDDGRYYKNIVNSGVYVFSPDILNFIKKGEKADFGRDVFPKIFDKIEMFGYNTFEYLKDMGTPERLEEVNADFNSGKISCYNYKIQQKAIFLDRDGVINKEKSFISKPEDLILYDFTSQAIGKINKSKYLAITITNQSVIARNLCTIEELEIIHKKLETDLGAGRAYLDALYYCPHHPDKGYPEENPEYKIDCHCRKPKTGLFKQASADFNINLSESYMIGDSERDIIAGKKAGCTTVGVMTGYGVRKTSEAPDFFFKDLENAVDFILYEPYKYHYKEILKKFLHFNKSEPYVISIAGNSRSGKSNFAAYIRKKFEKDNFGVIQIELDNWILPEEERDSEKNINERFQINKIENDLISLLKGNTVSIYSNTKQPEGKSRKIRYNISEQEIVIIEGLAALSNEKIRNLTHLKIYMDVDKSTHVKRINEYYIWHDKKKNEIDKIIMQREKEEYHFIEKESKFADLVIKEEYKKNTQ